MPSSKSNGDTNFLGPQLQYRAFEKGAAGNPARGTVAFSVPAGSPAGHRWLCCFSYHRNKRHKSNNNNELMEQITPPRECHKLPPHSSYCRRL